MITKTNSSQRLLAWRSIHRILCEDVKPKRCRVVEHHPGPATNYLHPVNTETWRKAQRVLLDAPLGERTHCCLLRHRRTTCQYLGFHRRWPTWSNICGPWSQLGSPRERPLQSWSSCALWQGAIRESQLHNSRAVHPVLDVLLLPGSLAATMLVHPAAVRQTVRTKFFIYSLGWEPLDALVSVSVSGKLVDVYRLNSCRGTISILSNLRERLPQALRFVHRDGGAFLPKTFHPCYYLNVFFCHSRKQNRIYKTPKRETWCVIAVWLVSVPLILVPIRPHTCGWGFAV